MQVKFVIYDPERQEYDLMSYCEIEDYDTFFKSVQFMIKNEIEGIHLADATMDADDLAYYPINIYFKAPNLRGSFYPCIVVELEEI